MEVLANLEPKNVMHWFEFVCSYPHGSLKEEKLAAAIMEFARSRGLECKEDAWHNVLVRKPASPGYENQPPVLLQAHIDMIWAKEKGVVQSRDPATRITGTRHSRYGAERREAPSARSA